MAEFCSDCARKWGCPQPHLYVLHETEFCEDCGKWGEPTLWAKFKLWLKGLFSQNK